MIPLAKIFRQNMYRLIFRPSYNSPDRCISRSDLPKFFPIAVHTKQIRMQNCIFATAQNTPISESPGEFIVVNLQIVADFGRRHILLKTLKTQIRLVSGDAMVTNFSKLR